MLLGKLEIIRDLVRHHPHAGVLALGCDRLDVVPGDDVDQEVKLVILSNGHGDIITL